MDTITKKIEELFHRAGVYAVVEPRPDSEVAANYVNIDSPDGRLLIGPKGEHVRALELIVKRLLEKETGGEAPRFFLDINGYRMHHIETLKDEAKQVAKKVRLYRKDMTLQPMSAFERRIVHMVLAEYPDITTESVGEGERRRVVIKPYP